MGKNKAKRFQENKTFTNLVQPRFEQVFRTEHPLKGGWGREFFGNDNPIVLELGCGRGEYTVELARKYPDRNFIGVDIKGARMWRGAKTATEEGLRNAGFLRTRIEFIGSFFAPGEVSQIWITFPDPQMKKNRAKKRLTAPQFLDLYNTFLADDGVIHLKTDSRFLHDYTAAVLECNGAQVHEKNTDIYGTGFADDLLSVKTTYEKKFLQQGLPITYLKFGIAGINNFLNPQFDEEEDSL